MSGERGEVSLVGLIVAMGLFIAVLTATLSVFESSTRVQRDLQQRADQQDRARVAVDILAKQLRNLASPTQSQPQAVDRAGARDIVFKTVDPVGPNAGTNVSNVKRMRYCLDAEGRLWRQQQRWTGTTPPGTPAATACPGPGWDAGDQVAADSVVNDAAGRAVFTYDTTTLTAITAVRATMLVDLEAGRGPTATELSTGVFLRNQNRGPAASFTATPGATEVVLNGSTSSDPEGDNLTYLWYRDGNPDPIGSGIVLRHTPPDRLLHAYTLTVKDSAGLQATAGPTSVKL